jgi:hypothetical protein
MGKGQIDRAIRFSFAQVHWARKVGFTRCQLDVADVMPPTITGLKLKPFLNPNPEMPFQRLLQIFQQLAIGKAPIGQQDHFDGRGQGRCHLPQHPLHIPRMVLLLWGTTRKGDGHSPPPVHHTRPDHAETVP